MVPYTLRPLLSPILNTPLETGARILKFPKSIYYLPYNNDDGDNDTNFDDDNGCSNISRYLL